VSVLVGQQSESALWTHIALNPWASLPFSPPSHPSRSSQSTELSFLCVTPGSPAIYFAHGTGHTSVLLSQFIPLSSSPAVSTCLFSYLHLHYCPANRFIYIIFLDFTYMRYYTIPVLLWVISFYMTSMSLQMTQFHSFSCLSNSPLCVCTTASLSLFMPE